jgi:hypothetical protein
VLESLKSAVEDGQSGLLGASSRKAVAFSHQFFSRRLFERFSSCSLHLIESLLRGLIREEEVYD